MRKQKLSTIFIMMILGISAIGISYAGFTDELYIFGEVDTATVELEILDYSGTFVYKIWEVTPGFGPKQEWIDEGIVDRFSSTEELLIFKGSTSLIPSETEVASYFDGNAQVDLISWAYAEQGSSDDEISMVYHNMFPCVDFTADFVFKYTGSIPAKIWAEYEITEDDDDLLAMLLAEDEITLEAVASKGIFGDTMTPVDVGVQVHGDEEIDLALTIHVPQENKYQGLSGRFVARIAALQWNEDPIDHSWDPFPPCVEADFTGEWDALWDTTGGPGIATSMTLVQDTAGVVTGTYTYDSVTGTIQGTVTDRVLSGTSTEGGFDYPIEFTLSCDGESFTGSWFSGSVEQGYWNGVRVIP